MVSLLCQTPICIVMGILWSRVDIISCQSVRERFFLGVVSSVVRRTSNNLVHSDASNPPNLTSQTFCQLATFATKSTTLSELLSRTIFSSIANTRFYLSFIIKVLGVDKPLYLMGITCWGPLSLCPNHLFFHQIATSVRWMKEKIMKENSCQSFWKWPRGRLSSRWQLFAHQ